MENSNAIALIFKHLRFNNVVKNQAEFGEKLGYKESFTSKIISGKQKFPDDLGKKLSDVFGVRLSDFANHSAGLEDISANPENLPDSDLMLPHSGEWFRTGENQMEDLGNGLYRLHTLLVDQKSAAGYLTGWGDQEYLGELKHHTITVRNPVRGIYRSFQINANNESMDDNSKRSIEPGDIVTGRLLQRSLWKDRLHYKRWPFWVIIHKTEGITTKEIVDHNLESGIIMCHSLNPKFDDFPLFLDDVIQLFNVIKVEKEL